MSNDLVWPISLVVNGVESRVGTLTISPDEDPVKALGAFLRVLADAYDRAAQGGAGVDHMLP